MRYSVNNIYLSKPPYIFIIHYSHIALFPCEPIKAYLFILLFSQS